MYAYADVAARLPLASFSLFLLPAKHPNSVCTCVRMYVRAISKSKTVENQGFRTNGHQIRILLIEIYLYANFELKWTQPAPVFDKFSKCACNVFVFRCLFFVRNRMKIKEPQQTDIIFKFSSSRSIGSQIFSPNGCNQPTFSTTFQFLGV